MQKVELKSLKPSSVRDFSVDPIDPEIVSKLQASIKQHGFWGGVVVRKVGQGLEIVAGAHRVTAAIASGIKSAELHVVESLDDEKAIRLYADENATQRGNGGTAAAGSVAAALRFLMKKVLSKEVPSNISTQRTELGVTRAAGYGIEAVAEFLFHGVVDHKNTRTGIRDELANLKSSGHYARILREVEEEIAKDKKLTPKVKEFAKKVSVAAAQAPKTFDYSGVAGHLKCPAHIVVFRRLVTSPLLKDVLPVEKQEALAAHLVQKAAKEKENLTSDYIHNEIVGMVMDTKAAARKLSDQERKDLEQRDKVAKARRLIDDFSRGCNTMMMAGHEILNLQKTWPDGAGAGAAFPLNEKYHDSIRFALQLLNELSCVSDAVSIPGHSLSQGYAPRKEGTK